MKKKVLSLKVQNSMGILARITGLFSGKGYSLKSLTAGTTPDSNKSKVTIVCESSDNEYDQVKKQLNKLIEVIKLKDLTHEETIQKELAYIKIKVPVAERLNVISVAESLGAAVRDISKNEIVFEMVCSTEKINHFVNLFSDYQIDSVARSGLVAMELSR
ncbi:MAG: acetolactate synthase small subunit [Victivallales bacterium]|nr:acetolactate synthase small subunit [Victivallales bacterium]MCF7889486.1 acetolactate synthase small subunit [Victivallales bacterium]